MIITIHGTGIELTEAIRQYATEKVESLEKFFDNIVRADIDVGKLSNHHQKGDIFYAEVNLHIPGKTLRVVKEEADLYKAIDKVKDHLKEELNSAKDKMRHKNREEIRHNKEYPLDE